MTLHSQDTALSLRPCYTVVLVLLLVPGTCIPYYTRKRRPGCFPGAWNSFASRQFAPKIVASLSASIAFCFKFFLVSDRSGRRKPPAERSVFYII